MAIASLQQSNPIYGKPRAEAAAEILLDMWCTGYGDKTVGIPEIFTRECTHPDWLIENMLCMLSRLRCASSITKDAIEWDHQDFYITGMHSFTFNELRICIRPKTEKEKSGQR